MSEWRATEISEYGKCKISNDTFEIDVYSDFSGYVKNVQTGEVIEFVDLRDLIDGAALLKEALEDYYGKLK